MKPLIEFGDESGPILPAATIVLMRDGPQGLEALLVQRSKAVKHMGGMWVFPGGKTDEADYSEGDDDYTAAVNAAIREIREEAGLNFCRSAGVPLPLDNARGCQKTVCHLVFPGHFA